MKKRLLSLISVMALCFTAMPSYAVAEDTNDDIYEYELILSCSETHFYDDDDTLTYFYVDTDYEGDEITLIDADNLTEYTMVDDGKFSISGDDVPYDGVYSTRFELDTTMTSFSKEYHFYAFTEDGSKSNTVSVKITKRLTDVQIHEMSAVDEAVSNLKSGVEYSSASYDDKITMMYKLLADLAENGTEQYPYSLIQKDSIKLSDDRKLYSYNYHFGMASSALIDDPSFQTETTSTATITTTESSTSTTTVATTTETTPSTTTIETSSTTQTTTTTEETTSTTETTEPNFLLGDCNGDGNFGVSDVVLLQKWLLAVSDVHFADWKAADFCDDDKLDVFDLCLMKRALIEDMQAESTAKIIDNAYLSIESGYDWINNMEETSAITSDTVITDGYIAVFHGEAYGRVRETYIYKTENGAKNYGFEYVNIEINDSSLSEQINIIGKGSVMWTDDVFLVAKANNAYDYVTIPSDETIYTIDEFIEMFIMN